jgi:Nucleotidyl transferase AbiEii toxin, Type IV TA system
MEQLELLRYALGVMESLHVEHMLVGSMASMAYGEPRMTRDIDLVVNLRDDQVGQLCDGFPEPEFYVSRDAAREAVSRRSQFNVIHPTSGNKIDLIVARSDAWGQSQLARRKSVAIRPDLSAPTAAPEDVILGKMWYYRVGEHEKHLRDIASMLRISGDQIDRDYISHWAQQLELTDVWQTVLARVDHSP